MLSIPKTFVACCHGTSIQIYYLRSLSLYTCIKYEEGTKIAYIHLLNKNELAVATKTLDIWNITTQTLLYSIENPLKGFNNLTVMQDYFLYHDTNDSFCVLNRKTEKYKIINTESSMMELKPINESQFAVSTFEETISIWNLETLTHVKDINLKIENLFTIEHLTGDLLLTSTTNGINLVDWRQETILKVFKQEYASIWIIQKITDSIILVNVDYNEEEYLNFLFNLETQEKTPLYISQFFLYTPVAVHGNLITYVERDKLCVFDVHQMKLVNELQGDFNQRVNTFIA
jgi:hypothetical protein